MILGRVGSASSKGRQRRARGGRRWVQKQLNLAEAKIRNQFFISSRRFLKILINSAGEKMADGLYFSVTCSVLGFDPSLPPLNFSKFTPAQTRFMTPPPPKKKTCSTSDFMLMSVLFGLVNKMK